MISDPDLDYHNTWHTEALFSLRNKHKTLWPLMDVLTKDDTDWNQTPSEKKYNKEVRCIFDDIH